MRRWMLFAVTLLILPAAAVCQSGSADSQTLQALLAEMRQLRQELRTATVAAQRAQILIYRVQAQQAVVTRLSQRVDNNGSRLAQNQNEQKMFASQIKRLEDQREAQNESERKQTDEQLTQMKMRVEQLTAEEQDMLQRKIQLEDELRVEQTKLAQLHDELDRIDKALEQTARAPVQDSK